MWWQDPAACSSWQLRRYLSAAGSSILPHWEAMSRRAPKLSLVKTQFSLITGIPELKFTSGSDDTSNDGSNNSSIRCWCDLTGRWYLVWEEIPEVQSVLWFPHLAYHLGESSVPPSEDSVHLLEIQLSTAQCRYLHWAVMGIQSWSWTLSQAIWSFFSMSMHALKLHHFHSSGNCPVNRELGAEYRWSWP